MFPDSKQNDGQHKTKRSGVGGQGKEKRPTPRHSIMKFQSIKDKEES